MVAAVGTYLKSWVFVPEPVQNDFVTVQPPAQLTAADREKQCSICLEPLFDPDETIVAHPPAIGPALCCHIHLDCLSTAIARSGPNCPTCRMHVDHLAVQRLRQPAQPLPPPPTWADRIQWVSQQLVVRGGRALLDTAMKTIFLAAACFALTAALVLTGVGVWFLVSLFTTVAPFSSSIQAMIPLLISYPLGALPAVPLTSLTTKLGILVFKNEKLTNTAKTVLIVAFAALALFATWKISETALSFIVTKYLAHTLPASQIPQALAYVNYSQWMLSALRIPLAVRNAIIAIQDFYTLFPIGVMLGVIGGITAEID